MAFGKYVRAILLVTGDAGFIERSRDCGECFEVFGLG
jgi:hypothetical protein